MFTGIIETVGVVAARVAEGAQARLSIDAGRALLADLAAGDSIAVNGVCLSVTSVAGPVFAADVSTETLACTTLGALAAGARVNLEKALRVGDRLGGHLLTGHVDGVGVICARREQGAELQFDIEVPAGLERYLARKGSVAVDGVSLTVNAVRARLFTVQIIPLTRSRTLFGAYRVGDRVNIEVDLLARYLERLLEG